LARAAAADPDGLPARALEALRCSSPFDEQSVADAPHATSHERRINRPDRRTRAGR
jgi:hypothetical protein